MTFNIKNDIFLLIYIDIANKGKYMSFLEIEKSARLDEWSMQDLHSHPHHEIYYLSKGNRKFLLSNALYNIQAPAIIVIPPHVMHKTEGDAFERYNINVAPSYLDAFQAETLEKLIES